eukprot:7275238-Alexandrium_andersonii.AAC.1
MNGKADGHELDASAEGDSDDMSWDNEDAFLEAAWREQEGGRRARARPSRHRGRARLCGEGPWRARPQ